MIKARINQLHKSVDKFMRAVKEWAVSTNSYVSKEFEDAATELFATFSSDVVPPAVKGYEPLVKKLETCWGYWAKAVSFNANPNELPSQEFWDTLKEMANIYGEAHFKRTAKRVRSLEELTDKGVNDEQVCLYYGWTDDRGVQMNKVREEREVPGTHLGDSYVSPQQQLFDEEYRIYTLGVHQLFESLAVKTGGDKTPHPEKVRELVEQNVSLNQIMLITNLTEEEARAECVRQGVETPDMHYNTGSSHFDPEVSEIQQRVLDSISSRDTDSQYTQPDTTVDGEEIESIEHFHHEQLVDDSRMVIQSPDGETLSMESQVIVLHQAGMKDSEIAQEVGSEDYPVSHQRVNGVIRRWKRDPSQFSVPTLG